MRTYELTVLIHPDLESDLEKPLKKVRDLITANKGKIAKEDIWGKQRLAYRIKRQDFAVYAYFELELPPEAVKAVDSNLNITDEVLRHLLVAEDLRRPDETETEETTDEANENKED